MQVRIPHTPPHVSINRVRIVDLPDTPLDHEVRGKTAYELVSSAALIRYARERAWLGEKSRHAPYDSGLKS